MLPHDRTRLLDICQASERVGIYLHGIAREAFFSENMRQDAVIRQMEIMGEAVTQISRDLRLAHPSIDWKRIAGLRNLLIHAYKDVDIEEVWAIGIGSVPQLLIDVRAILDS